MHHEKFGIYLNVKQSIVMRISSPYWIPSGNEWVLLTENVNETLLNIRDLVREKGLVDAPGKVDWGSWSQGPQPD
jgi:hypothetical protein